MLLLDNKVAIFSFRFKRLNVPDDNPLDFAFRRQDDFYFPTFEFDFNLHLTSLSSRVRGSQTRWMNSAESHRSGWLLLQTERNWHPP